MPTPDFATVARERLRAAAVPEDEISALLARATDLVAGLARLAELDPDLPEPALTWRPVEEEQT